MSQMGKLIADRYLLKDLIGQGGMADVYLAEDTILKRTVAVKVMRSSLTGDSIYVTRFHREASAAASLSHKNIVEIYDVGEDGDDYYIVMEYVPGQTLKELIHKRGALHYVEAVDILKQVVSATAKAHSMGIVHRDLKPQNILVTDSGVVKIADFGIASIQSLSQVTQTDTIMGSLHYLAPEIARGEKATPQSDIYALGIVFYELLRGDVPFNGESPVNIALKHMRDDIPSVCQFNPSIPQSVENIIIKATAKNIKDRYQNAQDMFDDLSTCLTRKDEEKLVFEYKEETETIVADDKDFFTQSKVEPVEKVKEEKDNKKSAMIIGGIVTGVIVLCALVYFMFLKPPTNFSMPDVVGLTKQQAVDLLESKGLEVSEQVLTELSDDYDEGVVIATNPTKNSAVDKGTEIILTVSSGKYTIIGNYVGLKYNDIKDELEKLENVTIKVEEENNDGEEGLILKQSLDEGEKLDPTKNTTLTLTISKYSKTVPNVYGIAVDEAKEQLTNAGFKVKTEVLPALTNEAEIKTMKINVVYKQSLNAFSTVKKRGTEITLYYYDKIPELPSSPVTPPDNNTNTSGNGQTPPTNGENTPQT